MKKSEFSVAVIGATGIVGEEIVRALSERGFPVASLKPFATEESVGKVIAWEGSELAVEALTEQSSLAGYDFVFFAAGESVSREWAERAASAGAFVIDTSNAWSERTDVAVVVPEVNAAALRPPPASRIAVSPDAVAIALSVFLAPLRQRGSLRRVVATVFDPASVYGWRGVRVLEREVYDLLNGREPEDSDVFPERVAFNLVPQVGDYTASGQTDAEERAARGLERVLGESALPLFLTRVQVPVFYGTAMAVHVEFANAAAVEGLVEYLRAAPGLLLEEEPLACPSLADVTGSDATHAGRVRLDPQHASLDAWLVLDNTRKGSAVNAVQIAEVLLREQG